MGEWRLNQADPPRRQRRHIVKPDRNITAESRRTRTAILDAAEQIMREEGYAAVSTRRVAAKADVNTGLVHYYFGAMDDLFVELFQRGADKSFQRQVDALSSEQPLWALWEILQDQPHAALTMEFVALANHRKAIKSVIAQSSRKFRKMQEATVSSILKEYEIRQGNFSPPVVILLFSSISRFLLMEQSFGISSGHEEMTSIVEGYLREVEGERRHGGSLPPQDV
jgi:AcrR family transcriptional regulator